MKPIKIIDGNRHCTSCGRMLPIELFYRDKSRAAGTVPTCIDCSRKHKRIRYANRTPEQKQRDAKLRSKWRNNNRDKHNSSNRKSRENNKESVAEYRAGYNRRNSVLKNVLTHNYRARKRNAEGSFTLQEWRALCEKYHNLCLLCLKKKTLSPDHVLPLSKGGSNSIDNIQCLCRNCNYRKGDKYIDYRPLFQSLLQRGVVKHVEEPAAVEEQGHE